MRLGAMVSMVPLLLATGGWWAAPTETAAPEIARAGVGLFAAVSDASDADVVEPAVVASLSDATLASLGPVDPVEESAPPEHDHALAPAPPVASALLEDELAVVRWTTPRTMSFEQAAMNWGMWSDTLRELNPEHADAKVIEAGTPLVVHRADPNEPTMSIGAPNRGRLRAGIPLPEGEAWRLRDHRARVYGAKHTIAALVTAFRAYGATHPDGPEIRLGEISRRTGGKVKPHVSHRTGRDVDIGYIMKPTPKPDDRYWRRATASTLDVEKTWTLIESLLATGQVQSIFISSKLQRVLAEEAAKHLSPEEVNLLFAAVNPDPRVRTVISHEHGHVDHMHVRFKCEPGNLRCRGRARE